VPFPKWGLGECPKAHQLAEDSAAGVRDRQSERRDWRGGARLARVVRAGPGPRYDLIPPTAPALTPQLELAGSLESSLQELKRSLVTGVTKVQTVARLSKEIAPETPSHSRRLCRRGGPPEPPGAHAGLRSQCEHGLRGCQGSRRNREGCSWEAAAATDLDRISDGVREASRRFQA
jgi:hypothetical protein